MSLYRFFLIVGCCLAMLSCSDVGKGKHIGFLDAVEDATLADARAGFVDALAAHGWSEEKGTLQISFRNAQGDIPTLLQSVQFFEARGYDLIAANATISTITAVRNAASMPICMMVSPEPWLVGLSDSKEDVPSNLFGVYETLDYMDTAFLIIQEWLPQAKNIGVIYNQAELQSINALQQLQKCAQMANMNIIALPVSNSSETQLVTESLINKGIDAFFAMPDNIIFSSFEVILQTCKRATVPVFTSEAGLVRRGALAAYGADFYQWGYQAGLQAVTFLETGTIPPVEAVKTRKKVFNAEAIKAFGFSPGDGFEAL